MSNNQTFSEAYIKAALWSSTDNEGRPLDDRLDIELSTEAREAMAKDCAKFQSEQSAFYLQHGWSEAQAGHDFWLTRNGHGTGFWDRDFDNCFGSCGRALTEACKAYPAIDLYVGDDGNIYC